MSSYTGIDRRKKNQGPPKGVEERRSEAMGENGQSKITLSIKTLVAVILVAAGIGGGGSAVGGSVIGNGSQKTAELERRVSNLEAETRGQLERIYNLALQNTDRLARIEEQLKPRRR